MTTHERVEAALHVIEEWADVSKAGREIIRNIVAYEIQAAEERGRKAAIEELGVMATLPARVAALERHIEYEDNVRNGD